MQDNKCPGASVTHSEAEADIVATTAVEGARVADAKERDETNPTSVNTGHQFRVLVNPTWQDLLSFLFSLGALISILAILVLLGWDTLRETITIEPISVPKSFADEKGFGSDVASRRLQDAIETILTHITQNDSPTVAPQIRPIQPSSLKARDVAVFRNPGEHANFLQQSDLPSIVIPGVGTSLNSFATTIQGFLGLERRLTISGEFTIFDGHISLVLRSNRHRISVKEVVGDPDHPKALLDQAARDLVDKLLPTLGAKVHNNNGNDRHRENMPNQAISEYGVAIQLDPKSATRTIT